MKRRLRMIVLDLKRSWVTALIAPILTGLLLVNVLLRVEPEFRVFTFGLRAQQLLSIAYLFWPMLHLKTWFESRQVEGLRSVESGKYACSWTLLLMLLTETVILLPFVLTAKLAKLDILKECIQLLLLSVSLTALLYLITLLSRSVTLAMTVVVIYVLFCVIFYNISESLRPFMLIKTPALTGVTWQTLLKQQLPAALLAVFGIISIGIYEKKRTIIK